LLTLRTDLSGHFAVAIGIFEPTGSILVAHFEVLIIQAPFLAWNAHQTPFAAVADGTEPILALARTSLPTASFVVAYDFRLEVAAAAIEVTGGTYGFYVRFIGVFRIVFFYVGTVRVYGRCHISATTVSRTALHHQKSAKK
jgi:hypothetical protein